MKLKFFKRLIGPSQVSLDFPRNRLKLLGGVGHNNIFIKIDTSH